MPVKLTLPPTAYPITLQEAKDQLRVTGADEDSIIIRMIKTATNEVENVTGRKINTQTWTLYVSSFGDIEIPFGSLQSVSTIKYYDVDNVFQTLATSVYDVDTFRDIGKVSLAYGQSWPNIGTRINPIEIEFVCGYTEVPYAIKSAVSLKVELLRGNLFPNEIPAIENAFMSLISPYIIYRDIYV